MTSAAVALARRVVVNSPSRSRCSAIKCSSSSSSSSLRRARNSHGDGHHRRHFRGPAQSLVVESTATATALQRRTAATLTSMSGGDPVAVPAQELGAAANIATGTASGVGVKAPTERKKRVLSGVQPTGSIHLGNYLGAIKNWVALQDEYDTFYCVVDLHAITLPHDPKALLESTRASAALYLACGVDPEKSTVFVQSHVTAHTELTWLLNCATPMGWLNKMIQFKEKSRKAGDGESVPVGLLDYPVLMASDILLYDSDLVPVGEDQRQHIELARDIAGRINNMYGGKKWKKMGGMNRRLLKEPEAMIPPAGARVMSLVDGTSKMSKSAEAEGSRINLLDPPDVIRNKVKRCKTDAFSGIEVGNPERPECTNLVTIYSLAAGMSVEEAADEVRSMNWGQFKPLLADALIAPLEPIQSRYHDVTKDPAYLDSELLKGAERAEVVADKTLGRVKQAMGFLPRAPRKKVGFEF